MIAKIEPQRAEFILTKTDPQTGLSRQPNYIGCALEFNDVLLYQRSPLSIFSGLNGATPLSCTSAICIDGAAVQAMSQKLQDIIAKRTPLSTELAMQMFATSPPIHRLAVYASDLWESYAIANVQGGVRVFDVLRVICSIPRWTTVPRWYLTSPPQASYCDTIFVSAAEKQKADGYVKPVKWCHRAFEEIKPYVQKSARKVGHESSAGRDHSRQK